jgi:pimeloyl-ACP methyl ester carboxylesterase
MFGISWGGFNSIQMAMRHPPALKAILAVDATEELFHDDIHYIDGMMHFDEFELNMDLAPAMTGAPDYHARRKSPRPALRLHTLVAALLQAPTRRAVLACSCASAQRNQNSLLLDWRAARRISRLHTAHACASQSARESYRWPVESHLPQRRRAGTANRMERSSATLVGLVAQRPQQRNYGGTAALYLYAGVACPRSSSENCAGQMARRDRMAAEERGEHDTLYLYEGHGLSRPLAAKVRHGSTTLCSERGRGGRILVGRTAHRSATG